MSIVLSRELDRGDLLQLGNNVLPHVVAECDPDFEAINRSLQAWDEQLDEAEFA